MPPAGNIEKKLIYFPKGYGIEEISNKLHDEGVIYNPSLFKILAYIIRGNGIIKAGEYEIPPQTNPYQIIKILTSGKVHYRSITIPEGLTVKQIYELIDKAEGLMGESEKKYKDGDLLPETYFFSYGDNKNSVLDRMAKAMRDFTSVEWERRAENLPFKSIDEAIILASIVERETGKADERPRVAAVYINRLRIGMILQADPTVIYGLSDGYGDLKRELTRADLQTDNPYNTYKNKGLTPTAIANPGKASIRAVLNPDNTEELYFVADGKGGHFFAKTLDEHNQNVARYRTIIGR